jgi:VanZ family protein
VPPQVQNLLHIPVYAGLAFLWRWALVALLRSVPATVVALVVTVGYGVFDEWYQSFISVRFASLTDVLFNALGAGLGLLVFWWWQRRRRKNAPVTPEPR